MPTAKSSQADHDPESNSETSPIKQRVAKNGQVTYTFQIDVGKSPDGRRDRPRFTYPTKKKAIKEYRRIKTEVDAGIFVKLTDLTVNEAIDKWVRGRRRVRRVTLEGYEYDLKPVRRRLGGKKLRDLAKDDVDELVEWMLSEGRVGPRHYQPDSLCSRIAAHLAKHPAGLPASAIKSEFPDTDIYTALSALYKAGRVRRPRRGFYIAADPATISGPPGGVKPITVRTMLSTFGGVVQSFVDQGALPRNVVKLVERPLDEIDDDDDDVESKSWSLEEVTRFREFIRGERLYACWLLSCYGARRSEVLGLRWSRIDDTRIRIRRGRVKLRKGTDEGLPKSKRSRRDLPPPADLLAALKSLKIVQKAECLARGESWSDDRLVAVHPDGTPITPEWYSDEFHRIRERAKLRRILLKGLRNTSVSLMLTSDIPAHIVAAWHGHHPAVTVGIYSEVVAEDLQQAGGSLFPHIDGI
ncbi:site-specific integrase [Nocardia puris]|uniref:site-specific integrase n=1 Tax=Nocardia puris TaxID=208602 RepID=UPI001894D1D6|nr:site-specific integrase [Nocardia puris]MBF6215494.1 site-specific integrase [Nocardia puris]MBF6369897.1 site-specific integrase [Nocardia puris]